MKFGCNRPSSFRGEVVWNCGRTTDDGQTDDGRTTDNGACLYYKLPQSLRLRWAKKKQLIRLCTIFINIFKRNNNKKKTVHLNQHSKQGCLSAHVLLRWVSNHVTLSPWKHLRSTGVCFNMYNTKLNDWRKIIYLRKTYVSVERISVYTVTENLYGALPCFIKFSMTLCCLPCFNTNDVYHRNYRIIKCFTKSLGTMSSRWCHSDINVTSQLLWW